MLITLSAKTDQTDMATLSLIVDHKARVVQIFSDPSVRLNADHTMTPQASADWSAAMAELEKLGAVRHEGDYDCEGMDVFQFAF